MIIGVSPLLNLTPRKDGDFLKTKLEATMFKFKIDWNKKSSYNENWDSFFFVLGIIIATLLIYI